MQFLNPLPRYDFNTALYNCPRVLDLLKFRVFELGQKFLLCHRNIKPRRSSHLSRFEKVVMLPLCGYQNQNQLLFSLLAITHDDKLALFRSVNKKWNVIQETHYFCYADVIVYKGRFYAVDETGRTAVVGLNSVMGLVAYPIFGGDKKYLVESDGELMLADVNFNGYKEKGGLSDGEDFVEDLEQYGQRGTIMLKVFRLDFETQSWIKVRNLGDKVLFSGDDVTFSASVSDLHGCKGNCIFFVCDDPFMTGVFNGELAANDLAVFDLESESLVSLENAHEYFKMFWPPPNWVISISSEVENFLLLFDLRNVIGGKSSSNFNMNEAVCFLFFLVPEITILKMFILSCKDSSCAYLDPLEKVEGCRSKVNDDFVAWETWSLHSIVYNHSRVKL